VYARQGDNSVSASAGWTTAEFNVFGDGGSSAGGGAATFNNGASIVPSTRIAYGGTAAPTCVAQGFTGETNNLSFGPTAPSAPSTGPALAFSESTAGGASSNCAAATSIGDTHLTTSRGLFYDFQASGDYLLAQSSADFAVQARQVSGAPTWPNATTNSAVAAHLGKTDVAICLAPTRVYLNGALTDLGETNQVETADSVDVTRLGSTYFIIGPTGDSVRATVNPTWIDVLVGLGSWPTPFTGLLANADGRVDELASRAGDRFTNPLAFGDLYGRYGDTWRIGPADSLLAPCGPAVTGNPTQPFFARDLEQATRQRAAATCQAAGVVGAALLDACTLDVAVLGTDQAAQAYVGLSQPAATGNPITGSHHGHGALIWLALLLIVTLLLLLVTFLVVRPKPDQ
jgi:hypothetical protein